MSSKTVATKKSRTRKPLRRAPKQSATPTPASLVAEPAPVAPPPPWRLLGQTTCRSCGARYRVTEAPLSEVIRGWYRCGVCAHTLDRWAAPAARSYTPI